MRRRFRGVLLALACTVPLWAQAAVESAERIGRIRTIDGQVTLVRSGAQVPVAVGAELHRGDVIRTGRPGAVGLVLEDETIVSLGSGSDLTLVDFAFAPKEGRFALVMKMARGTFSYLSGLIGKLSPGSIQLQLPDATIAVRGTKLLITIEE
jgi:hypothetical protein